MNWSERGKIIAQNEQDARNIANALIYDKFRLKREAHEQHLEKIAKDINLPRLLEDINRRDWQGRGVIEVGSSYATLRYTFQALRILFNCQITDDEYSGTKYLYSSITKPEIGDVSYSLSLRTDTNLTQNRFPYGEFVLLTDQGPLTSPPSSLLPKIGTAADFYVWKDYNPEPTRIKTLRNFWGKYKAKGLEEELAKKCFYTKDYLEMLFSHKPKIQTVKTKH